ncbi:TrbI/VirB10 family protein [Termitidicoccus mucosus]|uniref:TrbI/VirB10 family protein n=1 Tax=Termitidicoccus mucosus TaxID=1184151 RepID=A0A178ILF1_9BACT|nr:hypothetical protein AW736_09510 [Opitutaceae bacterium TSB47]
MIKRIIRFIKTPLGSVVSVIVFVVIGALLIHGENRGERPIAAAAPPVPPMERHTITRDGQPLKVPAPLTPVNSSARANLQSGDKNISEAVSRPRAARQENHPDAGNRKGPPVLPISLLAANSGIPSSVPLSPNYAPYGRLIPCETIITLESSKTDTPIIGLVTEDVWHDGRLIIPAGAEVHGRASQDRARERIAASGQWVIVWRDRTTDNGLELTLNGIALDRERDEVLDEYGLRDGSAGLVGQIIKTDDWQDIKLFASTFLAGMAGGFMEMQDQSTALGVTTQIPRATAKNAALAGTADVLNAYAAQISKMIAEEGFYIRVPAGKQFYLYVTQTLDKAGAARGGNGGAKLWQKTEDTPSSSAGIPR